MTDAIKVGDKVIYGGFEGVVLDIWDGKYIVDYKDGEQYNPYRITVRMGQVWIDKYGGGVCGDGTISVKLEALTQ